MSAIILGEEFPIPDFGGDPEVMSPDPLEGKPIEAVANEAGEIAVSNIPTSLPGTVDPISPELNSTIREIVPESINDAVKSVPVMPEGTLGQTIQASITEEITGNPKEFHNKAMSRAIQEAGGDVKKVTPEGLKKAYTEEANKLSVEKTQQFKEFYGDVVHDTVKGIDPEFDAKRPYENGKSLIDQMVDDPKGTNEKLLEDAKEIEKANPDWKEKVKQVAGYGAKGLLVLAVIGAFIPGGLNVIKKLAGLAGKAVAKVVNVAANILKAFLGPFLKIFWDTVKKFKGPFIILGIILIIMLILWIYRLFV